MLERNRLRKALLNLSFDIHELDIGHYEKQSLTSFVSEVYHEVTFNEDPRQTWYLLNSLKECLDEYRAHLDEDLLETLSVPAKNSALG